MCLTTVLVLFPQNFFVLDPDATRLREWTWRTGQFAHLLWLSCFSCLVLLVFLTLFFFSFHGTHCFCRLR